MSEIEHVYIQKKNGEFATINGWPAWFGFDLKAYPISFFEWSDLRDGVVKPSKNTIVVGSVKIVLHALRSLDSAPALIDYPESLTPYLGRRIWPGTMADARGLVAGDKIEPVFVKPRDIHKAFTGYVLQNFRDLIPTARMPDELNVWMSEVVNFESEWRYFVHRKQVVGVGHYHGDPFVHPDKNVVLEAVAAYADAPRAYALDFGVTSDGRTLVVEANDAYSLGNIGLRPLPYANMLEDRWLEMTGR